MAVLAPRHRYQVKHTSPTNIHSMPDEYEKATRVILVASLLAANEVGLTI
jgi:hypothetical protein